MTTSPFLLILAFKEGKAAAILRTDPHDALSAYPSGSPAALQFLRGFKAGLEIADLRDVRRNLVGQ